jgi:hypothetical protein
VVGAWQEVIKIAPYRKVHTVVRLSVHMLDERSGEQLLQSDVLVDGQWGMVSGEGALIPPGVVLTSPEMQEEMAHDFEHALEKALDAAAARVDQVLRPLGKVVSVAGDGQSVTIIGGSSYGFLGGDKVVIFRVEKIPIDQKTEGKTVAIIASVQPVAEASCDGVGTASSRCLLTLVDKKLTPQKDDYVILSDLSAIGVREH